MELQAAWTRYGIGIVTPGAIAWLGRGRRHKSRASISGVLGTQLFLGRCRRLSPLEDQMSRFIAGIVFGCLLGIMGSAFAAGVFGVGKLDGWTVVDEGQEVCFGPSVDTANKVIRCD
jgi:cation transporter-like permease